MSQVKNMVTLQTVTREKVIKMLGITENQYGEFLMDQAFAYLDQQLGNNIMCKSLSETAMFWGWWKNHWHQIDMLFVDEAKKMSERERWQYYKIVHSIADFEYTPPKSVLRDAFTKLNYQPKIIHHL